MSAADENKAARMDQDILQKSLDAASKVLKSTGDGAEVNTDKDKKDEVEPAQEEKEDVAQSETDKEVETVDFKVIFSKKKYDVTFPLDSDLGALKVHLQPLIGITPAMMKVVVKGVSKDEMTLRKLGVTKGSKVMVVGSSLNDVLALSTKPTEKQMKEMEAKDKEAEAGSSSKAKLHKKILEKGKPDDVMPGVKGRKEPLPPVPISGMLNSRGGKVRLTFKMEMDQVWIGTKERTEKLGLTSIKNVVNEPIEGHEEYHIIALQLGPTEASRYWIYWVPAQYVDAIKDCIMGKWQIF